LDATHKTYGRVLPQPGPMEVRTADKPGQARNVSGQTVSTSCGDGEAVAKRGSKGRKARANTPPAPSAKTLFNGAHHEVQHVRGEMPSGGLKTRRPDGASPKENGAVTPQPTPNETQPRVFVLDKNGKPLMPCHPARARELLDKKRARVHKMVPFTIRLVDRNAADCVVQPITVKLDPGAGTTGVAVVRVETTNTEPTHHVIHLSELEHRGKAIRKSLKQRAGYRRRRRSANLRYRPARFDNRTRKKGWLAPSLQHRVDTVFAWVTRYRRLAPISSIAMELVRFDTHGMSAPEVAEHGGVAYQQGELSGYEVREYLLEKWHRKCAYCDKENVPLQIEHVVAKTNGGSNRVSNLTLSCEPCNRKKGAKSVEAFLACDPERLVKIKAGLKKPLDSAAAMNATRWALWRGLTASKLPGPGFSRRNVKNWL